MPGTEKHDKNEILLGAGETYIKACDRLFTITEKDVIKNAKGRLYYNGQYVLCNLIGSALQSVEGPYFTRNMDTGHCLKPIRQSAYGSVRGSTSLGATTEHQRI